MKSRLFIFPAMVLFAGGVFANEVPAKPANELQEIENQLKTVLSKLGNEVTFKNLDSESFEISYHTRKFIVHSGTMIGKFSENTIEQTGPDYDGFKLWVQLQNAGVVNQAETPQVIKAPYWNTYLDVTSITGTNKQVYWGLSYWGRTDQKVLSQIKEALWKLDKSPKKVPYKAEKIAENQGEQLTGLFKKNLKSNSPYRLELTGGDSINLRGKILENLKEDTRVWVTGKKELSYT